MKDLKTFFKEKKEKLKIAGSIASAIAIISTSSCSISNNDSNSSKQNSSDETNPYSATTKENTTIETKESASTKKTTTTTEKIKPITTRQTTIQETTNATTIAPATTPFTTVVTPKPVETIVTTKIETTKPIITTPKPIVTTTTTTTTATTIKPEPIEYNTRTEEIKAYYNNISLNDETKLTKNNINDYQTFLTIANNLYSDTSIEYNKNGYNIFFTNYAVYYNLDTNEYERYVTDSYLEKLIFLTLLNYEYIDDNTLNKLLKIYTQDELNGIAYNSGSIFLYDLDKEKYYDYDKIIVDENLKKLLINIHNAYKKNDYITVEKLSNDNFGKYNNMVDIILLTYAYMCDYVEKYPCEETPSILLLQVADSMGVYERAHQKTLVLQ